MALALTASLDVDSLRPGRGTARLVIEIASGKERVEVREASCTVFALDVSSSMFGAPLDHVVRSVDRLLDALLPDDEVGVVAFADAATEIAAPAPCSAEQKRLVRSRVGRLAADGQTNIESGLVLAADLATREKGRCAGV